MRWFFDVSKVKESSFFKSDLTDLTDLTLDAHLFENINFSFSKLNALKKFHFDKEMRKKRSMSNRIMVFTKLRMLSVHSSAIICVT